MARNDPYRNFPFRLEIDGVQRGGFSEVSGLGINIDPVDYRDGNDATELGKLAGLAKYGSVTLKRGIADSSELYDWHRQSFDGEIQRKTVVIVLIDEAGNDKTRFEIDRAWPTKYDPMGLNAKGNEISIETLELCNEGVRRIV
jgi:phage tail-like protein